MKHSSLGAPCAAQVAPSDSGWAPGAAVSGADAGRSSAGEQAESKSRAATRHASGTRCRLRSIDSMFISSPWHSILQHAFIAHSVHKEAGRPQPTSVSAGLAVRRAVRPARSVKAEMERPDPVGPTLSTVVVRGSDQKNDGAQ